jgi:SAM-dependent methyltransferase
MGSEVVWHDLECGGYRADLPLWRELAARSQGPILDVGAGTGRVTLDLARAGHHVTALDLDPDLLDALQERARAVNAETVNAETVQADARAFALDRHDYGLCLMPMQTLQLLGGSAGRVAFMRCARAHLRRGGIVACAIVTALEPFDCTLGETGPSPETTRIEEIHYLSRATRVSVLDRVVVIERERRTAGPAIESNVEHNVVELDRVKVSELEAETVAAGLNPAPARVVHPTSEHVGSTVVVARA